MPQRGQQPLITQAIQLSPKLLELDLTDRRKAIAQLLNDFPEAK